MFSATALFSTVVEAAALHCSTFCCAPSPSLSSALTAVMRLRFSPNANSENPVYPKKAACTDVVAQAARRTRCFDHKNRAAPRRFVLLSELLQLHMHIHTNLLRRKGVRHTAVVSVYINEMGVIFGIYKWVCVCVWMYAKHAPTASTISAHTLVAPNKPKCALSAKYWTKAATVALSPYALTPGPGSVRHCSDVFNCGFRCAGTKGSLRRTFVEKQTLSKGASNR